MKIVAGIDVSKETLDVHLQGQSKTFDNDRKGFDKLVRWCKKADLLVMEATGIYHLELAIFLCSKGVEVAVVNPAIPLHFARSLGKRNKTDKVDAMTLAQLGQSRELSFFIPPTKEQLELCQLVHLRTRLVDERAMYKIRMQTPTLGEFERSIMAQKIEQCKTHIELLEKRIASLIQQDPHLSQKFELITTIPGIGEVTAWTILAELRHIESFASAKKLASFVGICPTLRQSGTSLKRPGQLSRQGNSAVRKALYMASMASLKHKGVFAQFFHRLVQKGKGRKMALVAVMHKLIRVVFGVIKSRLPFIPERALTSTT